MPAKKRKTIKINKRPLIIGSSLAIIVIALIFFVFVNKDNSVVINENQEQIDQEQIDKIIEKVSDHYLLPQGENPVIATVTDAAVLSTEQEFYKDVVNGDNIILFIESKRAIIYSPSRDIVVNVGPIVSDEEEAVAPVEEVEEVESEE